MYPKNKFKYKPECYICNKRGHKANDCWHNPKNKGNNNRREDLNKPSTSGYKPKFGNQQKQTGNSHNEKAANCLIAKIQEKSEQEWIIDSEGTRSLIIESGLPIKFWAEAKNTYTYLKNRTPSYHNTNKTPEEMFTGRKPTVSHLKVFGCKVEFWTSKHKRSIFEKITKTSIFVGYSSCRKAYRICNPENFTITETRDVAFLENQKVAELLTSNEQDSTDYSIIKIDGPAEEETNSSSGDEESSVEIQNPASNTRYNFRHTHRPGFYYEPSLSEEEYEENSIIQAPNDTLLMTQYQNHIPKTYKEAIECPQARKRYKARLVAAGYSQKYGIDYYQTFSPVISSDTLRILLCYAAMQNYDFKNYDIETAYLYGDLQEKQYILQPEGFEMGDKNMVDTTRKVVKQKPKASGHGKDNGRSTSRQTDSAKETDEGKKIPTCFNCGTTKHHYRYRDKCPAKDKETLAREKVSFVYAVRREPTLGSRKSSWKSTVRVNGTAIHFKLDPGSDVTLIPFSLYKRYFSNVQLTPTDGQLMAAANQRLENAGTSVAKLRANTREMKETVYVVHHLEQPLLGVGACEDLQLVRRIDVVISGTTNVNPEREFPKLFEGLGLLEQPYQIKLKEGAKPFSVPIPRRVPLPLMPKLKEQLDVMVAQEVIEPRKEEHDETLREVLRRLKNSGITLNKEKCQLGVSNVTFFLGHYIDEHGIKADEKKLKAIAEMKPPADLHAEITKPLNDLRKKDASFIWGSPQKKAFEKVKDVLASNRVLASFDISKKTMVSADASSTLWLEKPSSSKQIKPLVPIFTTKGLNDLTPRLQRYRMRMLQFSFHIFHTPRKDLITADALSRQPIPDDRLAKIALNQKLEPTLQNVVFYSKNCWPAKCQLSPLESSFYDVRDEIGEESGLLMRGLRDMVKTCEKCIKNQPLKNEPFIPNEFPERPWQKVGMDIFHYEGSEYLVVADYFSRFIEVVRIRKISSEAVVDHCKAIFARHGIPDIVISDNGPQFRPSTTSAFTKFASEVGFRHITSSPKHPQSNGQAEAAVIIVKNLMKKNKDPVLALMEYRATPPGIRTLPCRTSIWADYSHYGSLHFIITNPKTVDQSKLRGEEEQRKMAKKTAFDRRHAATKKAELIAGEKVWVKDLRASGSVIEKASAPRSYIVETPVGTYRRDSLLLASSRQQVDTSETSPDSQLPAETEETPGNELTAEELEQQTAIAPEMKQLCPSPGKVSRSRAVFRAWIEKWVMRLDDPRRTMVSASCSAWLLELPFHYSSRWHTSPRGRASESASRVERARAGAPAAKEIRPKENCHREATNKEIAPAQSREVGWIKLTSPKTMITTLTASQLSARREIKASRQLLDQCRVRSSKSTFDQMVFLEFLQEFSPVDYIDALENLLGKDCVQQLAKMSGQILAFPYRKKLDKITLNGLPFVIEDSDVIKALRPFFQVTSIVPVILTEGKRKWQDTRRDASVLMHDGMKPTCGSLQPTYSITSFTPAPPAIEVSAICDPVAVVSDPTPATSTEHETSSEKEKIVENKTILTDKESLPGAKTREQKQQAAVLRKTSKLFEETKNVRLNKKDVLRAITSPIFLTKYLKELDNVQYSGLHLLASKLIDKETNVSDLDAVEDLCLGYTAALAPASAIRGSGLACLVAPGISILRKRIMFPGKVAVFDVDVRVQRTEFINCHLSHLPDERLQQLQSIRTAAVNENTCILEDFKISEENARDVVSGSVEALIELLDCAKLVDSVASSTRITSQQEFTTTETA
ncbi:K02A2.6-like [Cordylochernes scorpioides]|uniref:K02A2.6-like n=1 Tax=Cordylochernes scorpioides TaxID=51811 RepID=A0ABY6K9T1_9ARAC|nr:K02A2.6-like [Cordylochernes scorpioides]